MDPKSKRYLNIALYVLIAVPVVTHIWFVWHYALNIPMQDDYDAVLATFNDYKKALGFDKIAFLFAQEGEHRNLFSKLVILAHYYIFGNINFRHIILFDMLMLLSIFGMIVYFIRRAMPNMWQVPVLILSYGIFDLNNFENSVFVSAGVFNYSILFFFLLSMLFFTLNKTRDTALGAFSEFMLIFSGGNGMIGAFFIVLYTILCRDKKKMIFSISAFVLFVPLYFYHYNFHNANAGFFTLDINKFLPFFINALGANTGHHLSWLFGVAILITLINVVPIYKKAALTPQLAPFVCIALFILASLGVMSIFRGNLPPINAFANRYMIYSHTLIIITFLFIFQKSQKPLVLALSSAFAILLYSSNFRGGYLGYEATYNNMINMDYDYPEQGKEHAKQIADESCRLGMYCLEQNRKK